MILDTLGDQITPETPGLSDQEIILQPGSLPADIGLVMKFAMGDRYNKTPEPQLVKGLEFVKHLWIGKVNEEIGGVVMLCWLENLQKWTLDAYKNSEHDNKLGDYSFRAGQLVIDWFFKNIDASCLTTMHRTDNRLATKMCERLGFEITHKLGEEFVFLTLERETWDLRRC
jgi:hypothetical protein